LATADLGAPEAWHEVGPGSNTEFLCNDPSNTAVFCSESAGLGVAPWSNFGGGFVTAGFRNDLGVVHLEGVVKRPVLKFSNQPDFSPIFRLPAAYRPNTTHIFASVGRDENKDWDVAPARVAVQPDGLVVFEQDCFTGSGDTQLCSSTAGYLTLDGISFRPGE
jgi:hypothetical protein